MIHFYNDANYDAAMRERVRVPCEVLLSFEADGFDGPHSVHPNEIISCDFVRSYHPLSEELPVFRATVTARGKKTYSEGNRCVLRFFFNLRNGEQSQVGFAMCVTECKPNGKNETQIEIEDYGLWRLETVGGYEEPRYSWDMSFTDCMRRVFDTRSLSNYQIQSASTPDRGVAPAGSTALEAIQLHANAMCFAYTIQREANPTNSTLNKQVIINENFYPTDADTVFLLSRDEIYEDGIETESTEYTDIAVVIYTPSDSGESVTEHGQFSAGEHTRHVFSNFGTEFYAIPSFTRSPSSGYSYVISARSCTGYAFATDAPDHDVDVSLTYTGTAVKYDKTLRTKQISDSRGSNDKQAVKKYDNQCVVTTTEFNRVLDKAAGYYAQPNTITVQYRGRIELEPRDVITVYDENYIRWRGIVLENAISITGGVMTGTLRVHATERVS